MRYLTFIFLAALCGCGQMSTPGSTLTLGEPETTEEEITLVQHPEGSWPHFLQHLPLEKGPILDYTGSPIGDQEKHYRLVKYDVGTKDLQQCADALMRLRAEYLFREKRYSEIGFHFTDGSFYSWDQYCLGRRPRAFGNALRWVQASTAAHDHRSLRAYLDIVYMYAGTLSLAKELKTAGGFEVGTIVIKGGSPGHCFIIVNEGVRKDGSHVYQLAEGYTPAQSICILSRPGDGNDPWYSLSRGTITTSSYIFTTYKLGRFE